MMETLLDTGSLTVKEVLKARSNYPTNLMKALNITTFIVSLWVIYVYTPPHQQDEESARNENPDRHSKKKVYPLLEPVRILASPIKQETEVSDGEIETASELPRQDIKEGNVKAVAGEPSAQKVQVDSIYVMVYDVGYTNECLADILADIGNATGLGFTYPQNLIDSYCCITIAKEERTVYDLLQEILKPRGLKFYQQGRMAAVYLPDGQKIIISPNCFNKKAGRRI